MKEFNLERLLVRVALFTVFFFMVGMLVLGPSITKASEKSQIGKALSQKGSLEN